MRFLATDYGAVGDGATLNNEAIERAVHALENAGGGELVFPAGVYLAGKVRLVDNMTLILEKDAFLKASDDIRDYFLDEDIDIERNFFQHYFLYGKGICNLTIAGEGCIEGAGQAFWENEYFSGAAFGKHTQATSVLKYDVLRPKPVRPVMLYLADCRQVRLEGFAIRNAPAYTVWTVSCENVLISRLTIRNPEYGPNTDALDIDCCRNVVIEHCDIEAGDDCVALKSDFHRLEKNKSCENIAISDCRLKCCTCAIRIGYEGDGPITNVSCKNILVEDTRHGIDMLSIVPVCKLRIEHGTPMDNFRFENFRMRNVGQAFFIWAGNQPPHSEYDAYMRNLLFADMEIDAVGSSFIGCEKPGRIEKLTFRNIKMNVADTKDFPPTTDFSSMPSHWGGWEKSGGMHFHNVPKAKMLDCEIRCAQPGSNAIEKSGCTSALVE